MVALPPKGYEPTPEQITLPEGIDTRIAERVRVNVAGVLVGTDERAMESATEIVQNSGTERSNSRGCCRARRTSNQST